MALAAVTLAASAGAAGAAGTGRLHLFYEGNTTTGSSTPPEQKLVTSYYPCPGFQGAPALLGGGFEIENFTGSVFASSSAPYDQPSLEPRFDSWQLTADNLGVMGGLSLTERAVCGKVDGISYPHRQRTDPASKRTTIKIPCPSGKHVVGGGALEDGPAGAQRLVATAPFDSRDRGHAPDDGWRIAVDNLSGTGQDSTGYAICARVGGLHYPSRSFTAPDSAYASGIKQCANDEWVVGGGITQDGPVGKQGLAANAFDPTHTAWGVTLDNLGARELRFTVLAICHR